MAHIRKIIAIVGGILIIIVALFTSPSLRDFTRSPESKINQAAPLSEKLRHVKTATFEAASSAQWKEIEEELEARLKIRALHCAKGYSPAFYVSTETTKKFLTDLNCFTDIDNEIASWLELRRVGILLAKPALRPIPAIAPSFIVADATVHHISFAGNAGVAMLQTAQELQIIDIDSQKPLWRELKGAAIIGPLTPNGRLFITGETNRLKIRDAESGSVIAELNGIRAQDFHWLDEITALYNKVGSEKTFILDFSTGKELPVRAINKHVTHVVRLPQTTNQFAAFSAKGITKIELVRTQNGLEAKLLDEKHDTVFAADGPGSGLSSDGLYFFQAGRQLSLVSLNTLTIQTLPLMPFQARFAVATPDPDLILLIGNSSPSDNSSRKMLYSISKQALTPVEQPRLSAQRYVYANTLKRQAAIIDNKIALLEVLPPPSTEKGTVPASAAEAPAKAAVSPPVKPAPTPKALTETASEKPAAASLPTTATPTPPPPAPTKTEEARTGAAPAAQPSPKSGRAQPKQKPFRTPLNT